VEHRLVEGHLLLEQAVGILDGHRGIVDQYADGQRQAAQSHGVDGLAQRREHGDGGQDGERDRDHHDQGGTPGSQEDQDHHGVSPAISASRHAADRLADEDPTGRK
jgi:hypothetical protein